MRQAKTIGFDWGMEGGYAGHPVDNEGTNQSDPKVHGDHVVEFNIFERNEVSGVQGYGATGTFKYNLVQDNGGLGCAGAENAAFKSHGERVVAIVVALLLLWVFLVICIECVCAIHSSHVFFLLLFLQNNFLFLPKYFLFLNIILH